jgi:threonine dehydrogenase-like Zn-dependent dehydrogenase
MNAVAVNPSREEVMLLECPEPALSGPAQVRVRMREVGLCGTDREIAAFEYGTPPDGEDYLIIGHEGLGEVVEVGTAVESLRPGDLVVPMVRRPCRHEHCYACRAGRQDFCYTGEFTERGIKQAHGFLTETIVEEEAYLAPVPAELREVAVLTEPLTIAEKALAQIGLVQQRLPWACPVGDEVAACRCRAVVLGAGPIGILGAMALRQAGFEVFVYSRNPPDDPRAKLIESLGATYLFSEAVSLDKLAGRVGNIDVVYEATGAAQVSFQLMETLGVNGVFVLTGVPGRKGPVKIEAARIMRNLVLKNQVVLGTVNAGRVDFEAAIRDLGVFLGRWPHALRGLITGRHPISRYRELLQDKPRGIKNVIRLH